MIAKTSIALLTAALAVSACSTTAGNEASAAASASAPPAAPMPATPAIFAAGTAATVANFSCGETHLKVSFSAQPDEAQVEVNGAAAVALAGQRPASGIWYAGNGYELRGKGREATWTAPGEAQVQCTQTN